MHTHTHRFAVLLALAAPVAAQPNVWSMPVGYLSAEADSASRYFGAHANSRSMILDGLRTLSFVLTESAFRPDFDNYGRRPATGRAWSNVTLRMGEGDTLAPTTNLNAKLRTPQTTVFSAAVVWPTMAALPAVRPLPFSIRFPFVAPWVYTGSFDLCADYVFTGGTLANNGAWSSIGEPYPLDQAQITGLSPTYALGVPLGMAPGCADGAAAKPAELMTFQTLWHPVVRGDIGLALRADRVGTAGVMMAVGVGGSNTGWNLPGVGCQRVFVDLAQAVVFLPAITSGGTASFNMLTPYRPAYAGTELWMQAAWPDSTSNRLMLTPATRQGLFPPLSLSDHLEMFGTGNVGGMSRVGAPVCRFR